MELSTLKLKFFLYFRRELAKPENQKFFIYFFPHFLFVERELFKHKHKRKKFFILSL